MPSYLPTQDDTEPHAFAIKQSHTETEESQDRPKHLDGNVCSCPCYMYIVTIDPSKGTEKHIVDDKAVQSNIKLLTNTSILVNSEEATFCSPPPFNIFPHP